MSSLVPQCLGFAGAAAFTTALCLPGVSRICRRVGLVDDPGPRKIHSTPIPLAGGLAIFVGMLLALSLGAMAIHLGWVGAAWDPTLSRAFDHATFPLGAILVGSVAIFVLGWLDDWLELRPAVKFAGQLVVVLGLTVGGLHVSWPGMPSIVNRMVTMLWLLTAINALNFMDNMNGLCAGLGVIAGTLLVALADNAQGSSVAILASSLAGAALGFLPFNYPRARAFLGDAGSHWIGYWLGVLTLVLAGMPSERPRLSALVGALMIVAVPLIDLAWVVILRWRRGQPFYIGDTNHLSHQLVRRGLTPARAVVVLWLLAVVLGAGAFWLR